ASMKTPSVPPLAQVQPSPRTQGEASPWAVSGLAGTATVQFVEAAASSAFWVKLNAFPAASTAFAPASPARFAALFGGMAKAAAVAGWVAAAEPDADGQGAAAAELAAAGALAAGALAAGALAAAAGAPGGRARGGRGGRGARARGGAAGGRGGSAGRGRGARAQGRLRDRRRVTARDGDNDPERQAQCHRN